MNKHTNHPQNLPPANPIHHAPITLHHAPITLHHAPITLHHAPITLHAAAEPTRKRRGEAAEAAFLARATALGFSVLIPWGDSDRYDSVVELNHGLLRIQVKSATLYAENRYRVKTTGASGRVYTSKEIDFFVGHIVPENIWYIIPIQAIGHRKGIRFYPHTRRQSKAIFEKYREAWCLLDSCLAVRLRRGHPERCRSKNLGIRCAAAPNAPNAAKFTCHRQRPKALQCSLRAAPRPCGRQGLCGSDTLVRRF